jgi:hypothetical protein
MFCRGARQVRLSHLPELLCPAFVKNFIQTPCQYHLHFLLTTLKAEISEHYCQKSRLAIYDRETMISKRFPNHG